MHELSENHFNGVYFMTIKSSIDNTIKLEIVTKDVFEEIEICGDREGKYIFHLAEVYLKN